MIANKRPNLDEMLRATLERDGSYDGLFFACVKTTGIFCRPSCPARKPLARNMEFKPTVRECLLAGFRPCLRCKPLALGDDVPEWLGSLLKLVEAAPTERLTDQQLTASNVSPHAARRYFQRKFGLTFQAYHRARRMGLAHKHIRAGGTDLQAAFDHGYESLSGFRDAFQKTIGATPVKSRTFRTILTRTIDSPVGPLVACAVDEGLCLLEFADRDVLPRRLETIKRRVHGMIVPGINQVLEDLDVEMREYFAKERMEFSIPLITPGTPFQESVWKQLALIPYGQTRSYEQIAQQMQRPKAHRAVGTANGNNPISIIVPCHRVIRSDGSLSGYGGGLWRKHFLLDLERSVLAPSIDRAISPRTARASAS